MVYHHFDKAVACSAQLAIVPETKPTIDFLEKMRKPLTYLWENFLVGSVFQKSCKPRAYPAI